MYYVIVALHVVCAARRELKNVYRSCVCPAPAGYMAPCKIDLFKVYNEVLFVVISPLRAVLNVDCLRWNSHAAVIYRCGSPGAIGYIKRQNVGFRFMCRRLHSFVLYYIVGCIYEMPCIV